MTRNHFNFIENRSALACFAMDAAANLSLSLALFGDPTWRFTLSAASLGF